MAEPYLAEGPREHQSWKGVPIVRHATVQTNGRAFDPAAVQIPCSEISKRGGPPGDRTRDTVIKSHVLYH